MTEIRLRIDGPPRGKNRPRVNLRTGSVYTDDATRSAESRIHEAWHAAGCPRLPPGAVTFAMTVAVERPRNHWRLDGTLSAAGQRAPYPLRKPDLDNQIKLFTDSLNGCAYRDDVDIVHCWAYRRWCNPGETEHTMIAMWPAPVPLALNQRRDAA